MCFSMTWLVQLCIEIVVVVAIIAVLRIWVLPMPTLDPRLVATINVVIWAIGIIFAIWIIFELLACVGFGFPGRLR